MEKNPPFDQRPPEYDLDFTHHPHDRYFRFVLQYKPVVEQMIKCLFPQKTQDTLDLATLELSRDSFLDEEMQEHFSDICYTVELSEQFRKQQRLRKGIVISNRIRISLLFEHKSTDPGMEVLLEQLARYIIQAWSSDLRQKRPLSITIPIVIFHGNKPMKKADVDKIFAHIPEFLRIFAPRFDHILLNVAEAVQLVPRSLEFFVLRQVFLSLMGSRNVLVLEEHFNEIIEEVDETNATTYISSIRRATFIYLGSTSEKFIQKLQQQKMTHAKDIPFSPKKKKMDEVKDYLFSLEVDAWKNGIEKGALRTKAILKFLKENPTTPHEVVAQKFEVPVQEVAELYEEFIK